MLIPYSEENKAKFSPLLIEGMGRLGITLSDLQINQFYQFYEMLITWNGVMNLTAITEMEDVISKHFVDSASLIKARTAEKLCKATLIDIGTGAGFPGIPLKILFPDLEVVLVDTLNKRVQFLNEVIQTLQLKNVRAIHGRAEDCARDISLRGKFDYCVSRAVANMATLSEYCLPFVKIDGYFIPYKSGKIEEELQSAKGAIHLLGGKLDHVEAFDLPGSDMSRSLVLVKKVENTSKKYPRKAGKPSKEPLS